MDDSVLSRRSGPRSRRRPYAGRLSRRDAVLVLLDVYSLHLGTDRRARRRRGVAARPRVAEVKHTLEQRFRAWLGGDEAVAAVRRHRCVPGHRPRGARTRRSTTGSPARPTGRTSSSSSPSRAGPTPTSTTWSRSARWGSPGSPSSRWQRTTGTRWDGAPSREVHTELHHGMADALRMRRIPVEHLPLEALERKALNGYLATNRALQPEMLGSLGLLECQAGPRCRRVVAAMDRLGVPAGRAPVLRRARHRGPPSRQGLDRRRDRPARRRASGLGPTHPAWRAVARHGEPRFFAVMAERFGIDERAA